MATETLAFALQVRSVLADKTGEDEWLRAPPSKIPLPDGIEDANAAADWILDDQGFEPGHLLEE